MTDHRDPVDARLAELFGAWRAEIDEVPPPFLVDPLRAVDVVIEATVVFGKEGGGGPPPPPPPPPPRHRVVRVRTHVNGWSAVDHGSSGKSYKRSLGRRLRPVTSRRIASSTTAPRMATPKLGKSNSNVFDWPVASR
jgi:hypothetical protein